MAWLFGLTAILLLEPPPATTAEPAWVTAAGVFLFASIAATVAGLAMRARWSALTSVAASSVLLAGVVACPVTGHHAFGAWWVAQLVIATTLLAMGGSAALRPSA